MAQKPSQGIIFFGTLLTLMCATFLAGGHNYEKFRFYVQPLPQNLASLMFVVWIAFIILGIFSGIGLLLRKEIARKSSIAVGCYILYRFLIKIPFLEMKNISKLIADSIGTSALIIGSVWAWILLINLFAAALIYFLTRPKVKAQFN